MDTASNDEDFSDSEEQQKEEGIEDEVDDELQPLQLRRDQTAADAGHSAMGQQEQQEQRLVRSSSTTGLSLSRKSSQRRLSIKEQRRAVALARFKKMSRIVIVMINWIHAVLKRTDYKEDENIRVADTLKGFETDDSGLSFDLSYFRAKKEIDLTGEMKYILRMEPQDRSDEQVQTLMYGLQNLPTFNEYPLSIQEKLSRVAFYYSVPAGRLIIRQGHTGINFYIIISGKALVNVMKEDRESGETRSSIVARLGQGQSFGEIALLHQVTRTASIVSQTPMQLLAIGRDDFHDIFMRAQPGRRPAHIEFLLSCEFMRHFPEEQLLKQPNACLLTFYRRNAIVVPDSKASEYIVVVKSGSCKVLKRLEVNDTDEPTVVKERSDFQNKLNIGRNEPKVNTGLRKTAASGSEKQQVQTPNQQLFDVSVSKKRLALNSALGNNSRVVEVTRQQTAPDFDAIAKKQQEPVEQVKKSVAVQISTLKPGDVFGLSNVVFKGEKNLEIEESASVSLISNGSECLLFQKTFFVQHANELLKKHVKELARPYLEEGVFENNYYRQMAWDRYRRGLFSSTLSEITIRKNDS
ncbi:hypothetical protein BOX15_Mlig021012g1 [Macrostomum lignano]|uniref:Cyclic nucleotide-binding domain-containing protein n=1 Tax=Macrostomum lignano TaxID=282301 RepID=A0A267GEV4_9PLAT|nr:hypothetical protein BOX15_Mlig021012g1 [Macrostomum lignano]